MEKKNVNVGIIGTGDAANNLLAPAIRKVSGALLWSVLSRDAVRGLEFAVRHGACAPQPHHTTLESFLADPELDAVIDASPDGLRYQHVFAAARAGKHVFAEKPMGLSFADAQNIQTVCQLAGVKLAVGYHHRFHAGHRMLRQKIDQGAYGPIHLFRAHWAWDGINRKDHWRAASTLAQSWAVGTLGTHMIDLALWLLGIDFPDQKRIPTINIVGANSVHKTRDETDIITMVTDSGTVIEITCSVLYRAAPVVEIFGSSRKVVCTNTLGPRGGGSIRDHDDEMIFVPINPHVAELTDFVVAIRENREPEVGGLVGLANMHILSRLGI